MALTDNIQVYFKLDEASGARADATGTITDLTDVNTVGAAAGIINNGADFELDNSEELTHADAAALSFANEDFTICFWVKFESLPGSGNATCVAKGDLGGGATTEYAVYYNRTVDCLRFLVGDGTNFGVVSATTLGAPSTATWYFVCVRHDATANTVGISVNDGTEDTAAYTFGCQDAAQTFRIGNSGGGGYLDGIIDELGMWRRKLTDGERTQLYNAGAGLAYPFTGSASHRNLLLMGVG